jgi:deoxyribodipyrimidine photo-lyase
MKPNRINLPIDRIERLKFISNLFPNNMGKPLPAYWKGGRAEALCKLTKVHPVQYGKSRNFLDGKVTHLSPYLRHGCITLKEAVLATRNNSLTGNEKLLFEFAWRDYWRQIWYAIGNKIYADIEPPKVFLSRKNLPHHLIKGKTGLECIDSFVHDLNTDGYIHNHARMWLASYTIHWLGVDWQLAARWMHDLLIDGDEASNNLSWQWITSTFSSKPYFFNKENVSKYSQNIYCKNCTAKCPFDDTYENLASKLFNENKEGLHSYEEMHIPPQAIKKGANTVILFHDEMLSSAHCLLDRSEKKVFIFDPDFYKTWSINRLQFIADCLIEIPGLEIWHGSFREVLKQLNCKKIVTQKTPNLKLMDLINGYEIELIDEDKIYPDEVYAKLSKTNLKRFSKYWSLVSPHFLFKQVNQSTEISTQRDFQSSK